MTINDILKSVTDLKKKAFFAMKIRHCEPLIKKAIAELYSKGSFEPIEYTIKIKDSSIFKISTTELQEIYGMNQFEALLFLDAIAKADMIEDKTRLVNVLQSLTAGKHSKNPIVTNAMLENVKENNPDVWKHYQALCEKAKDEEEKSLREMEDNLNVIID